MARAKRARRRGDGCEAGALAAEIGKAGPFDSAEQEAFLNVMRTGACLGAGFERLFRSRGLSGATYNALRILRGHLPEGVPSQTIGRQLVAQVPDVTRLVDRLVEAGLAERCRVTTDRRVVMVKITRRGLAVLEDLDGPVRALHTSQLGHMTGEELRRLSALLVKAREKVCEEEDEA